MKRLFKCFSLGGIVFLLIGILLLISGYFLNSSSVRNKKRCTVETEAVVERIIKKRDDDGFTYTPVYLYNYEGKSVRVNGTESSRWIFDEGEKVKIFVAPDKPNVIYCSKEGHQKILSL
ncbi:DUF3592 domain-containing protein [Ruminococcus flavefaciens]|uniref:DUF3592 domain-containing protein n=1 Tax=Ruminococcus flavefaciens TaxID=1265 RepID=A0A1M7IMQ4_RUMFL|nr:DUF3592 domain-containing protein [Ruminococcus flavefaciens]SHM41981.1 Protein of unknown function [Ruminococcus flavefaciens]